MRYTANAHATENTLSYKIQNTKPSPPTSFLVIFYYIKTYLFIAVIRCLKSCMAALEAESLQKTVRKEVKHGNVFVNF